MFQIHDEGTVTLSKTHCMLNVAQGKWVFYVCACVLTYFRWHHFTLLCNLMICMTSLTRQLWSCSGNLAMVTGGHNLGRVGTITHREKHPGSFDIVHIKDTLGHTFATRWVLLLYLCMLSTFFASNPPPPPFQQKWIDSVLTPVLPAILPPLPSTKKQIDSVLTEYRCRMLLLLLNPWNAFTVKCRTTTCEMLSCSNAEEPSPVKCCCVQMQKNSLASCHG